MRRLPPGGAGPALAHIHPDPGAVAAGSSATVGFGVEHGCDGSPTVEVAIQLPDGFTDVAAVDKDGWTAAVAGQVVTYSGGSLDAETADSFEVAFTAPAEPGDYGIPLVQTCVAGELAWIEQIVEGAAEPERPAPVLAVTDGEPTAEEGHGHGDAETTSSDAAHDDAADDEEAAHDEDTAHHDEDATDTEDAALTAVNDDGDDGGSNTGVIAGGLAGAAVVAGGAVAVTRRRKRAA